MFWKHRPRKPLRLHQTSGARMAAVDGSLVMVHLAGRAGFWVWSVSDLDELPTQSAPVPGQPP
jgi:hypothetical protein